MSTTRISRPAALLLLLLLSSFAWPVRAQGPPAGAAPPPPAPGPDAKCLECHTDAGTTKTIDGKEVPLLVDPKQFQASVHGTQGCDSCHEGFNPEDVPHKPKIEPVKCTACHDDAALQTLVHGAADGPRAPGHTAPVCKDCHGTHSVRPAAEFEQDPTACLRCHTAIGDDDYLKSVHGAVREGARPASCAACHGSHVIRSVADPESPVHPGRLSGTCGECHSDEKQSFEAGVHWTAYRKGLVDAPTCSTCHDPHGTMTPDKGAPPVERAEWNNLCGRCHAAEHALPGGAPGPGPAFMQAYKASVHGRKQADGVPAATCVDCHGAHRPGRAEDPGSALGRPQTAATCGRCHEAERREYETSIHGQMMAHGQAETATCTDCHGEHNILSSGNPQSRVNPANLSREACGVCHGSVKLTAKWGMEAGRLATYEESYHGLANVGGSVRAANCASCHGYHNVLPPSDPASTVHPRNLQATCGKCHPNATERFTHIAVHGAQGPVEVPAASTVRWVYLLLIFGVIGGMVLHNLLIYFYHVRRKWQHERAAAGYQRFMRFEVLQHVMLALTFGLLVVTGFALKFPDAGWVQALKGIGLTEELRRWIHRCSAVVMTISSLVQAGYFVFHRRGRAEIRALLPTFKDAVDVWHNLLYHLGRRAVPPRFDRFDYTEKAEYLALIWGTAVMAMTGLVLWFPVLVSSWAPWWTFDVAQTVHYYEAWLATLAILVWHFFFIAFHPREYPLSTVFLNGRMSNEEWRERHPLEYERETGKPAHPADGASE